MKKLYFLLLAFSLFITANAQIVNIPDANFKARLLAANSTNEIAKNLSGAYFKVDNNSDGEIQETEALEVSYLRLASTTMLSMQGIEYFSNLNVLIFFDTQIATLNLSGLNSLKEIVCNENQQLTSLNFTGLNNLEKLICEENHQLSSLILTGLTSLKELQCYSNKLNALDLTGLSFLKSLSAQGESLTSLNFSGLNNLEKLYIKGSKLIDFDFSNLSLLQTLKIINIPLTSLDLKNLNSLSILECYYNPNLISIDLTGLKKIESIICDDNTQLASINLSGAEAIKSIHCTGNNINTLNLSDAKNIRYLNCHRNNLTSLNLSGLNYLEYTDCSSNLLTNLIFSDLNNFKHLICSGNRLSNFNFTGLNSIEIIECRNNNFTSLNLTEFNTLGYIDFSFNKLTSLNISGLNKLKYIYCSDNQLTSLDVSGLDALLGLYCNNNQLTSLNLASVKTLNGLLCSRNKLTTLDLTGFTSLNFMKCNDNNLNSLFIKNGKNDSFVDKNDYEIWDYYDDYSFGGFYSYDISNNPNLKYICSDEGDLKAIQNKITKYGYIDCVLNSYCSFVPGGTFYTIQGNQKLDSNKNGCDAIDNAIPNLKYTIVSGTTTGSLISNSTGNYSIPVLTGTHTITPLFENPTYFTVSPTTVNLTFPTQTSPFTQNFCITPNGVRPDLEVTLLPLQAARPGFDAKYKLVYKNKGNTTQSGSVNLNFNDSVLDLVVANPAVTSQTANNLSWDFSNLQPFETREITFTMNVNSPMETPAVNNDDVLAFSATITSSATDETPADNTFTFNQTVVGSYDPNDKTCLEGSVITPALIGQYVHYTIRFENTGTFAAENVVVKDMIDLAKFDISTLVPTSASHSYTTRISDGNKVEFIFENINLPFDDANNDGYIAFKIKTKPTLVVNDSFTNEANIYFDYNFPILTNKATSTFKTLGTQDFDFDRYFAVYPNPAKSDLNIAAKETINIQSMGVYNTLGQLVLVITNAEKTTNIDVSSLPAGNYFIQIKTDKGSSSSQFVKE